MKYDGLLIRNYSFPDRLMRLHWRAQPRYPDGVYDAYYHSGWGRWNNYKTSILGEKARKIERKIELGYWITVKKEAGRMQCH